jgi:hypothetical protein
MAKIGTYPPASPLTGTEELIGVQSAASVKLTPNDLKTYIEMTPVFRTTNYTANPGELVLCDSSGGAFTVTLPPTPSANDRIVILDVGKACSQYNVTVARNGKNIDGVAEDFIIDQDNGRVDAYYDGTDSWDTHLIGTPEIVYPAPGGQVLLGSDEVTGAAATSMSVSGLDLSAYAAFKVYVKLKEVSGATATIYMYYNSDTTAANYNNQNLTVDSSSVAGSSTTDAWIHQMHANALMNMVIDIFTDVDGEVRAIMTGNEDQGNVEVRHSSHLWMSAANVTSIAFTHGAANGFAVGCRMDVYGITK